MEIESLLTDWAIATNTPTAVRGTVQMIT